MRVPIDTAHADAAGVFAPAPADDGHARHAHTRAANEEAPRSAGHRAAAPRQVPVPHTQRPSRHGLIWILRP